MLLFYAIWINAKVFRAFNKTLKFDLKKALDRPGKSPPKFFLKSTTSQNNSIVLMEWTNYVAEKTISKIKRMERVCHPSQSSQNPSYPSVRLSMWLSICKALRQTKDYVIFFFSVQEVHNFLLYSWKIFPNSAFSHWLLRENMTSSNRPFYRYGSHFGSIKFKEYYGMPRGAFSTIRYTHSVFRRAFRVNFS